MATQNQVNNEEHYMPFLHTQKLSCRHIKSSLTTPVDIDAFPDINPSPSCTVNHCDETENWLCLTCYQVFCGRFGSKHMLQHYEQDTNQAHCIAMGITDLSFWCYKCNDYLHHSTIKQIFNIYKMAHIKKFGIEVPKKRRKSKRKHNPYTNDDNDYNFDPEEVKTWRYGSQISHSMEIVNDSMFIKLLNEFQEQHMDEIKMNDIDIILEIIVTFDRDDLLKLLLNHRYLSHFFKANQDQSRKSKPLHSALKKSIRSGKLKVLNYLINQNIINIQLFDGNSEYESALKSLLYTILRGIEIGSKKHSTDCYFAANSFWPFLCRKVRDLNEINNDAVELQALQQVVIGSDPLQEITLKSMNNDHLTIKYISLFMASMIKQRMKNEQYVAIFDVLKFLRERYITFDTRDNIKNGWIPICNELMMNYSDKKDRDSDCLELEMIDYLISGGLDVDIISNKIKSMNDKCLLETVEKGINNWNMKSWKVDKMKEVMPSILPIDLNRLIFYMLCL